MLPYRFSSNRLFVNSVVDRVFNDAKSTALDEPLKTTPGKIKVVATNVRHTGAIPATRFGVIGHVAQVHPAFV